MRKGLKGLRERIKSTYGTCKYLKYFQFKHRPARGTRKEDTMSPRH